MTLMPIGWKWGAKAPLALCHGLGACAGWLAWLFSARYRQRWLTHVRQSGFSFIEAMPSIAESGKILAELPRLWSGRLPAIQWKGDHSIAKAIAQKKSILFLTPHLGAFEVIPRALIQQFSDIEMHVLYRPPRKEKLRDWVAKARRLPRLHAAPSSLRGVRELMRALDQGQCIGILPDQVPPSGMGLWTPHFGKPAYTMTLAARLGKKADVILLAWAERLSWGRGYVVHIEPAPCPLSSDLQEGVLQINQWMEHLISRAPDQYLWAYDRYKAPKE